MKLELDAQVAVVQLWNRRLEAFDQVLVAVCKLGLAQMKEFHTERVPAGDALMYCANAMDDGALDVGVWDPMTMPAVAILAMQIGQTGGAPFLDGPGAIARVYPMGIYVNPV